MIEEVEWKMLLIRKWPGFLTMNRVWKDIRNGSIEVDWCHVVSGSPDVYSMDSNSGKTSNLTQDIEEEHGYVSSMSYMLQKL